MAYAPVDPPSFSGESRRVVDYFYDQNIGNYSYSSGHPMKQHRVRLAHSLILNYDLYTKMKIFRAQPASKLEMTQFHTEDYIDFLSKVTHENMGSMNKEQMKFNVGDDSPVFDGLFEYCSISAGGSLEGAARLGRKKCDIAVNWAGGLHHAKKSEASGFCYVNDIVLAIIELLRYHQRVVYVDIDVHHGDGVEEAFFTTDRVMTVSFHQYGEFFPGTGELQDVGADKGKYYAVNFPLRHGIDDASYKGIFEPVMRKVIERYRPGAIVLQCGGDSLSGDRLGSLNLSMRGHANCVNFIKSFGLPTLIVGGGGYTMRNVSRTWAYETGLAVGVDLPSELPPHEYYEYYAPDYELDVKASDMPNTNSYEYLEKIKMKIFENLKETTFAPSVQIQPVPRVSLGLDEETEDMLDDADEDENKDSRHTQRRSDKRTEAEGELSESEDEDSGYVKRKGGRRRRNEMSSREPTTAPSDADEPMSGSLSQSPIPKSTAAASQVTTDVEMNDEPPAAEPEPEESSTVASPAKDESSSSTMQKSDEADGKDEDDEKDEPEEKNDKDERDESDEKDEDHGEIEDDRKAEPDEKNERDEKGEEDEKDEDMKDVTIEDAPSLEESKPATEEKEDVEMTMEIPPPTEEAANDNEAEKETENQTEREAEKETERETEKESEEKTEKEIEKESEEKTEKEPEKEADKETEKRAEVQAEEEIKDTPMTEEEIKEE